jgi:hypothetical protein
MADLLRDGTGASTEMLNVGGSSHPLGARPQADSTRGRPVEFARAAVMRRRQRQAGCSHSSRTFAFRPFRRFGSGFARKDVLGWLSAGILKAGLPE